MLKVVLPREIAELSRKKGNKKGLPNGYLVEKRERPGKNVWAGDSLVAGVELRGEETVISIFEAAPGAGEFFEELLRVCGEHIIGKVEA